MSLPGESGGGRRDWFSWALAAAALVFGYSLSRRGLVLSDEGYLLLQAVDMANGKVLYRDMDSFVAPGVWFLLSTLFRLVEPSVWVSRLAALACWAATLWVSACIVNRLAGRRFARAVVALLMLLTVWAFPAWTWSFYSPYSMLFALAALERLLAWREVARGRDLVLTGAFLGLSLLFKQNYGAQALLGIALALVLVRFEQGRPPDGSARRLAADGVRVAAGLVFTALPILAYFVYHGALSDAYRALVLHPFGGFLGQHDIRYLPLAEFVRKDLMADLGRLTYGAYQFTHTALRFDWPTALVRGVEILHVLLYWLPPPIFATAAVLTLVPRSEGRRFDAGLASVLVVGGLLFLGVFPRADYNHLLNVYQPVVILGTLLVHRLLELRAQVPRPLARACASLGGVLMLLYASIGGYWYVDLLTSLTEEIPGPRGGVLLGVESRHMLEFEVGAIRAGTRPGDPVLTLPGLAMLNFLADRPNPSRYYNLYAVHIAHDAGAGVVEGSELGDVDLVVADYEDFFSERARLREYAPELTRYLRRHFSPAFSVALDQHLFLRRRPQPLPDRESVDALSDCDAGQADWSGPLVHQHLLFATLYHPLGIGAQPWRRQASTLCRVRVPSNGVLTFAAGYRQPVRVAAGAELVGEIWVQRLSGASGPQLVWRKTLRPGPATGWMSPPPLEQSVDLSRFGEDEVLLLFRTLYRGEVRMQAIDFRGFAMLWQDPRIEFEQ